MLTPLELQAVFTPFECGQIIEIAERRIYADAGLVRGGKNDNIRRARVAWMEDEGETAWVFEKLVSAAIDANRRHFQFDLEGFLEKMQVAWYDAAAGGHFDWHVDIGDGRLAAKRKLTLVAQLSAPESYAGAELEINADGRPMAATRALGAAVLFPSFAPHRVTPTSQGARYSLTTWIHGPAFR